MSTGRKELNKVTYPLFISGAYYETNKFGAAKVVGGMAGGGDPYFGANGRVAARW